MKTLTDVKKEYGYVLRWNNGFGFEDGTSIPYRYYLESVYDKNKIEISDPLAIGYIEKVSTNAFRKSANIYEYYSELFEILKVGKKK